MKRMMAIFLVSVLVMGLAGCGTQAAPSQETKRETQNEIETTTVTEASSSVVGTWELESVKLNGMTYVDADYLGKYDYAFTLKDDGTAQARVLGVTYSTTYTVTNDWITFADAALASVKLEVSGDTLLMKLSLTGAGLVFVRK